MIVCNINQIRSSLFTSFKGVGVSNESDIDLIYKHFYHGMDRNLTDHEKEVIIKLSESEVRKFKINNFIERLDFNVVGGGQKSC